ELSPRLCSSVREKWKVIAVTRLVMTPTVNRCTANQRPPGKRVPATAHTSVASRKLPATTITGARWRNGARAPVDACGPVGASGSSGMVAWQGGQRRQRQVHRSPPRARAGVDDVGRVYSVVVVQNPLLIVRPPSCCF